eukprot:2401681-Amphidinium_carterae.1
MQEIASSSYLRACSRQQPLRQLGTGAWRPLTLNRSLLPRLAVLHLAPYYNSRSVIATLSPSGTAVLRT